MQIMRGELVLCYLVEVDKDFGATNNIKYMQVPMSHWRQQSKKIGNVLIDTGMIKNCGVNQDQWRVKYWAGNVLVLRLYSAMKVGKILLVEGQQDQTTQFALCLVLFFMLVHMVAINYKGKFQAKERVMMLWPYFLFFSALMKCT